MSKIYIKKWLISTFSLMLISIVSFGQAKITGIITDADTKEPLIGVSVQVKNKIIGTITDTKGNFSLSTATPVPFSLIISSVGYQTMEVEVKSDVTSLNIALKEQSIMGQEVVVSASRVEESVMRSSVTVEKMDLRAIQQSAAPSFYDGLANMKGVDVTTQGLLFKSVNMRGFGATGNPRIVQMIDGMDNQAPGLNFAVDNIVGMPELDVESVEVLPGAASALYGPNAINGLILMNSKSPFLYQGLSATIKSGIMNSTNRTNADGSALGITPFNDVAIRYAKAVNDKFAYKVNVSYLAAQDWQANDYTNLNIGGVQNGTRGPGVNNDYDGMNVYGDEIQANMNSVANSLVSAGLLPRAALGIIPNTNVSRTGFLERDLVDYNTKSLKANLALHYRINEKVEAIGQVNYGTGTTVYTGTGRYSLRNFNITQAKLELRGDNFTLRGYTTQERSGESYTAGLAAVAMLNDIKPHATWFGQYVGAFAQSRLAGLDESAAHLAARGIADQGMPTPGTSGFDGLLNEFRDRPIIDGGGSFLDKTNLYHAEGVYNFKNQVKFVELLAGANVRQFQLRSNGTLFADNKEGRTGTIPINEYGAFVQAGKSLFKDHFKLTGSIRYDKNQNFDGQFTPRISGVTTFGEQNIRLSYQSGFRIPTTQNQYIDLRTPAGTLIGGQPEFDARYNLQNGISVANLAPSVIASVIQSNPAVLQQAQQYAIQAVTAQALPQIQAAVTAAITQQVTAAVTAQVNAGVAAGQIPAEAAPGIIQQQIAAALPTALQQAPGIVQQQLTGILAQQVPGVTAQVAPAFALAALPKYAGGALQPERIQSYEIGYKGLIGKKLFVDAYYYTSKYTNFIGGVSIVVPTAPAAPGLPIESGVGGASTRLAYSRPANTKEEITVNGWAATLNYSLPKGFNIGGNIAYNKLTGFTPSPEQQYAGFNTPEYRYNVSFGKRMGSGDKFGFNVNFRHQDAFVWEASFNQPTTTSNPLFTNTTVPAINNLDAQVSMKLPAMKSIIKIGGTNLGGKPYIQAFGSAQVGSMYYVSLAFDELLNK